MTLSRATRLSRKAPAPWYWDPPDVPQPWFLLPPALRYALCFPDGGLTAIARAKRRGWATVTECPAGILDRWLSEYTTNAPNPFTSWGATELRAVVAVLRAARELASVKDPQRGGFATIVPRFRLTLATLVRLADLEPRPAAEANGHSATSRYVGGKTVANLYGALQSIATQQRPERAVLIARALQGANIPRSEAEYKAAGERKADVDVAFAHLFTVTPLWLPKRGRRRDPSAYRLTRPRGLPPAAIPDAVELTMHPLLRDPGTAAPAITNALLKRLDDGAVQKREKRFAPADLLFFFRVLGARRAKPKELKAALGQGPRSRDVDARVVAAQVFFRNELRYGTTTAPLETTLRVLVAGGLLTGYAEIELATKGSRYVVFVARDCVFRKSKKKPTRRVSER